MMLLIFTFCKKKYINRILYWLFFHSYNNRYVLKLDKEHKDKTRIFTFVLIVLHTALHITGTLRTGKVY